MRKANCFFFCGFLFTLTIATTSKPAVTLYQEFFVLNEKKTKYNIVNSTEVSSCVALVNVHSINTSKWYYIICLNCKSSVQPYPITGGVVTFDCAKCGRVSDVDARYRLILNVTDHSSVSSKFFLFDGIAKELLTKGAAELAQEVVHIEEDVLPLDLQALIGKSILFKIRIAEENLKSRYKPFRVEKFSTNDDMIKNFASKYCGKGSKIIDLDGDSMGAFINSKDGLALKRTRDGSVKDLPEDLLLADKKVKVEPRDVIQSNKYTKANDETKEDNTSF